MFVTFTGLQEYNQSNFFTIRSKKLNTFILVFVSSSRLDPANRTVILDSAILSMTRDLNRQLIRLLLQGPRERRCGVPDNFLTNDDVWTAFERYAVRAAITLPFPVPLVEKMVTIEDVDAETALRRGPPELAGVKLWEDAAVCGGEGGVREGCVFLCLLSCCEVLLAVVSEGAWQEA